MLSFRSCSSLVKSKLHYHRSKISIVQPIPPSTKPLSLSLCLSMHVNQRMCTRCRCSKANLHFVRQTTGVFYKSCDTCRTAFGTTYRNRPNRTSLSDRGPSVSDSNSDSSCETNSEPYHLPSGLKRPDAPPRSPTNNGFTPSSARGQSHRRVSPPSPSPAPRNALPIQTRLRSTRIRNKPRRPLDTPPTPPNGDPSPPPRELRVDRHIGQRRCTRCRIWKADLSFARTTGVFYKSCETCRTAVRTAYRNRHNHPSVSDRGRSDGDSNDSTRNSNSESDSAAPSPFLDIPANPDNLDDLCLTTEAINCIQSFHAALDEERLETCVNCRERWFGMGLREGRCGRCRHSGHKWNAGNHADPGGVFRLM